MNADSYSALFGGISSFAAIATAIVAIVTLRQLRNDSKQQSRPIVVAELRPASTRGSQIIVIRNYGRTLARDISVAFDPDLPKAPKGREHSWVTGFLDSRYEYSISALAPSAELDNLYFVGVAGDGPEFVPDEPVPEQVTVSISYSSADRTDSYLDEYLLDVDILKKRTTITAREDPEKDQVESLKSIAQSMAAIARAQYKPDGSRGCRT